MVYEDIIRDHYRKEAKNCGLGGDSTMRDRFIRESETQFIRNEISRSLVQPSDPVVLEIGCGNGYTLSVLREENPSVQLRGLEFSEELHAIARSRNLSDTEIIRGDCRESNFKANAFSAVISQRVLINLLQREDQIKALRQVYDVLNPGGRYIMIEAFCEPLDNLNEARREVGLSVIEAPHHNLNFDNSILRDMESIGFVRLETDMPENFLSTHYFLARVFHETVRPENVEIRNTQFVRFFDMALPPGIGNFSPLLFLLFQKPE